MIVLGVPQTARSCAVRRRRAGHVWGPPVCRARTSSCSFAFRRVCLYISVVCGGCVLGAPGGAPRTQTPGPGLLLSMDLTFELPSTDCAQDASPSVAFCSTQDKEPSSLAIQMADLFPLRSRVFALSPHLSPVRLRFVCPVRTRNKKVRCPPLFSVRLTGVCLVTRAGPRHLADVTRKARWAERIAGGRVRRRRSLRPHTPAIMGSDRRGRAGMEARTGSGSQHPGGSETMVVVGGSRGMGCERADECEAWRAHNDRLDEG
jgi:hypothetical protein